MKPLTDQLLDIVRPWHEYKHRMRSDATWVQNSEGGYTPKVDATQLVRRLNRASNDLLAAFGSNRDLLESLAEVALNAVAELDRQVT